MMGMRIGRDADCLSVINRGGSDVLDTAPRITDRHALIYKLIFFLGLR